MRRKRIIPKPLPVAAQVVDHQRRSLIRVAGASAAAASLAACSTVQKLETTIRETIAPLMPTRTTRVPLRTRGPYIIPPDGIALLDDLERRVFNMFWEITPANGLTPDRWPSPSGSSIAAVGFALTSYVLGVERGFISREAAAARVRTTLRIFRDGQQGSERTGRMGYKGFFYHFVDVKSGVRDGNFELSTVDTALFLMGALHCQVWFDGNDPVEVDIRRLAEEIYGRVDWRWAQNNGPGLTLGWNPEDGFIPYTWAGYNEAMIVYLLAIGSPNKTYAADPTAWKYWTQSYPQSGFGGAYGPPHLQFAPMFGHQYSHVWVDFRGVQDDYMREKGIDYFENSRRATYAQRAYAFANPGGWRDYSENIWGITACDGPGHFKILVDGRLRTFLGYAGRGMGGDQTFDDGTLAPTAAASSLPFAPEIVIPALLAMKERYGEFLYQKYGFLDAFNPTFDFDDTPPTWGRRVPGFGWFGTDYIGIDQGPILAMAANHRDDLVWGAMRRCEWLKRGLQMAGFRGGWLG